MSTLNSLTRRLEKLESVTRAKYEPVQQSCVFIFYDVNRPDKDTWIEAEKARLIEQGAGYIKTIFIMPNKETTEENTARYAAGRRL